MEYVYGVVEAAGNDCVLGTLQNVERQYEFDKGVSRKKDFPADAFYRMSDEYPDNLVLGDVLDNTNDLLVVSQRFLDLLSEEDFKNNEVLPVKIMNHKDRFEEKQYFILNQLEHQDLIDRDQSELEVNDIDPEKIVTIYDLVLDESKIDNSVSILRMTGFSQVLVLRRDLADRIEKSGIKGIEVNEFDDWDVI